MSNEPDPATAFGLSVVVILVSTLLIQIFK